jgi:ribulose bisphosphate carboxylase small subunit
MITTHQFNLEKRNKETDKRRKNKWSWCWHETYDPSELEEVLAELRDLRREYPHFEWRIVEEITTETPLEC